MAASSVPYPDPCPLHFEWTNAKQLMNQKSGTAVILMTNNPMDHEHRGQ